ncbi:MAG: glycoside hydrolase family 3 protein [Rhabdochlamydiaceae bacterium]|nr:glycoside hydrolase family 3 protein [Candidatus Amphrikana amoebophyrae]
MKWLWVMMLFSPLFASEMSIEEKVGQLFMIPFDPSRTIEHVAEVNDVVSKYHIGGLITKATQTQKHREVLAVLQYNRKNPLLVSVDAEWGVNMRMKECTPLPRNMTLGAIPTSVHQRVGREIGREVRLLGAQICLGPVADVNINPDNPIIGTRSFGDSPIRCKQLVDKVSLGIKEAGVIPTLKHFPGHGAVEIDPHHDLPICSDTITELKKSHLIPFSILKDRSDLAVMTAHIYYPNIGKQIATFSSEIIENILRSEWGFQGLIISDALNMKALTNNYSDEEIAVNAVLAGHDILLYGDHCSDMIDEIIREKVPKAYEAVLSAVYDGRIPESRLDQSIRRIRLAREKADFTIYSGEIDCKKLSKELYKQAITPIGNVPSFLGKKVLILEIGEGSYNLPFDSSKMGSLLPDLDKYDIVVGLVLSHDKQEIARFNDILCDHKIAIVMTSPYVLQDLKRVPTLVFYENNPVTQQLLYETVSSHPFHLSGQLPLGLPSISHLS